jgi:hypothetical protein
MTTESCHCPIRKQTATYGLNLVSYWGGLSGLSSTLCVNRLRTCDIGMPLPLKQWLRSGGQPISWASDHLTWLKARIDPCVVSTEDFKTSKIEPIVVQGLPTYADSTQSTGYSQWWSILIILLPVIPAKDEGTRLDWSLNKRRREHNFGRPQIWRLSGKVLRQLEPDILINSRGINERLMILTVKMLGKDNPTKVCPITERSMDTSCNTRTTSNLWSTESPGWVVSYLYCCNRYRIITDRQRNSPAGLKPEVSTIPL